MRRIKLKDVCDRVTVGHVGPMKDEYVSEGVPFLRSQNIQPFRLNREEIKFITPEFNTKLKKSALRPGDVAVVRTGYPGTACVIPESLPQSNCADLVIITPDAEALDSRYLAAVFNSSWGQATVGGNLVGVAQQHFNVGAAKEMVLDLPDLPTQRRIAGILSAYDDLIENNLRRIRILEEMAQSLYREWFVHFRIPSEVLTKAGLPPELPLVDSPLGLVPEGWEVKRMPEAVEVRPKVPVPKDDEIPFVPMGGLSENSMLIGDTETRTKASGARFQNGDTLFARITPCLENGKTGFVQFLPDDETVCCGSTEFIVLRSRAVCPEYVYLMARSDPFRDNAIKSMSGATGRQRVQEQCFDQFLLAQPPADLLERFQAITRPQFQLIHSLNRRNQILRQTRDLLLPKLLSI